MLDFKIKGFKELQQALDELPDKIERNIVRSALRAAAKVVEAEVKRRVPVKSGELRDTVRSGADKDKETGRMYGYVSVGPAMKKDAGGKKVSDGKGWYVRYVEFGTKSHFIRPKGKKSLFLAGLRREVVTHPGAQKQPFMRPAFDASKGAAVAAFGKQVKKRLTKLGIDTPDAGDGAVEG